MARPSTSAEISCFLHRLATNYPHVTLLTLGHSVSGQPLHALLLPAAGRAFAMPDDPHRPITFFFLATQHGMEPAGGEALLAIAADLAAQPDPHAQFILMPNMNPDGRDRHRRVNARGVNLSTDFLALSQPETHACVEILRRFRPHVLLDIHESAALKKHSLGAQGFLLDFEAQFEPANNPNVHRALRALAFRKLLPDVLARVARTGLPAQRYIGEITSTNQILTHGGLSLRNVRNFAGIMGTCAFLLENRLDPSTGTYPTPRNIQLRVLKQISCIRAFTDTCRAHERAIRKATYLARRAWDTPTVGHRIWLASRYLPASPHAVRNVPLIRISDGARVFLPFRYHRMIAPANPVSLPTTYLIPPQHPLVPLLRRHNFRLEPTSTGMLCIPTQQPGGLLLPLLLEPVRETPVSNNTGGRY
ncbi:MAG: M14 family zinc carboxypeptidase [bacterium]|nr:M14 family zinc carboxypeptidase [bacterium]